jgi:hypothetical protein
VFILFFFRGPDGWVPHRAGLLSHWGENVAWETPGVTRKVGLGIGFRRLGSYGAGVHAELMHPRLQEGITKTAAAREIIRRFMTAALVLYSSLQDTGPYLFTF